MYSDPLRPACSCLRPGRRLFTQALLAGGLASALPAQASIPECQRSSFTKAVSADQVEGGAVQQYKQMLQQANSQRALVPPENAQIGRAHV